MTNVTRKTATKILCLGGIASLVSWRTAAAADRSFSVLRARIATLGDELARVDVTHTPDDDLYFAAQTLDDLKRARDARRATIVDREATIHLARAIQAGHPKFRAGAPRIDARWLLSFVKTDGSVIEVCFGALGFDGQIDGVATEFAGRAFEKRVASLLPFIPV